MPKKQVVKEKERIKQQKKRQHRWNPNLLILPLIILAAAVAVGSAIWSDYRDQIMENQKEQMLLTTSTLAQNMALSMTSYEDDLDFLCRIAGEPGYQDIYREFLSTQRDFEVDIFWENEPGGVTECIRGRTLEHPVLLSEIGGGTSVWQYEDRGGHKFLVFKKEREGQAALGIVIDEEQYYQKLISDIQIGTNGYVLVKNSQGMILMHPDKKQWGIHVIKGRQEMYPDLDYSSLEHMIAEQCSGKTGISEYYSYWWTNPDLPRVKKISTYAPAKLGDDFLVVSAVIDYDDFYLPIENGFRNVSLLYMGLIVALLLLFVYVIKLLVDRRQASAEIDTLQELNDRLEEVHRGEELLAHQQRLQVMGTMTGGIAHEFNNFLTPIMGHAELLMMELPEDSDAYDSALEIYEASEKAKDVIRQISSMSRRNVETVYKAIPAGKLFSRVVKMVESICPPHIRLESHGAAEDVMLLGNSTQINQVILNICVNAFHAIGKQEGTVRIGGRCVERETLTEIPELNAYRISDIWSRYFEFTIADDGCGMTPETLRQIFEPFFTTKKSGEGTGLGLALAEQIIASHKGHIYAESEYGKGTVFHVFLPVSEGGEEPELLGGKQKESMRLLIADDNAKVLELLKKNFARLGLPVAVCRKKEEILAVLEQEKPDALVIDESIEDGSGIEVCMAIQGSTPDLCKIIMADCVTKEVVEAKYTGIIDGYLVKPVSDIMILEVIRSSRQP